jgi:hypothetical protein
MRATPRVSRRSPAASRAWPSWPRSRRRHSPLSTAGTPGPSPPTPTCGRCRPIGREDLGDQAAVPVPLHLAAHLDPGYEGFGHRRPAARWPRHQNVWSSSGASMRCRLTSHDDRVAVDDLAGPVRQSVRRLSARIRSLCLPHAGAMPRGAIQVTARPRAQRGRLQTWSGAGYGVPKCRHPDTSPFSCRASTSDSLSSSGACTPQRIGASSITDTPHLGNIRVPAGRAQLMKVGLERATGVVPGLPLTKATLWRARL